jgi:hypothetical protein
MGEHPVGKSLAVTAAKPANDQAKSADERLGPATQSGPCNLHKSLTMKFAIHETPNLTDRGVCSGPDSNRREVELHERDLFVHHVAFYGG